jgi:hypothetical protein
MSENTLQFNRARGAWMQTYFLLAWCVKTACMAIAIPVFLLGCAILIDVCTGFDVIVSVATLSVDQKEEFSKLLVKAFVIIALIVLLTCVVYSPVVTRVGDRIGNYLDAQAHRIADQVVRKFFSKLFGNEVIEHVLKRRQGGVFKRMDENRELLQLLQDKYPDVLKENPWVQGWLWSQDCFLADLAKVGEIKNPHGKSTLFPRPWPGEPQTHHTIASGDSQ